jgi:uncharacterized protein (TIGR02757 family)
LGIGNNQLFELLEKGHLKYNNLQFIEDDPIRVPHQFNVLQDIEISGFFAATLAWGQRKTIISKAMELMGLLGHAPYEFVMHHSERDLKCLLNFKHRTFNATDLLYFIHFFKKYYSSYNSLEEIFNPGQEEQNVRSGIERFHRYFLDDGHFPYRTAKHVASPAKKSACKRINMFLRWMVRKDQNGVDFGLWGNIKMNQLVCPCDVHVDNVARHLGLITRKQIDWLTAEELTGNLMVFDPEDPVKYDFALFGMGLNKDNYA